MSDVVHRVYVGQVPAWLLAEKAASEYFGKFGEICSVDIHRDPMDTEAKGFCFVTYRSKDAAELAIEQINIQNGSTNIDISSDNMFARVALVTCQIQKEAPTTPVNSFLSMNTPSNRFSQMEEEDEDDIFLFNLSQRSAGHSQRRSVI
jgi:RNA recognition motif-containing protein